MIETSMRNLVGSSVSVNSLQKFLILCIGYVTRERWWLWLPVLFATGMVVYFVLPFEPPVVLVVATPVLVLSSFLFRRFKQVLIVFGIILAVIAGFNLAQLETWWDATPMVDRVTEPLQVTGRLMHADVRQDGISMTLQDLTIENWPADRTPVSVRIKLTHKTLDDVPPLGSVVNLWAQLEPINEPAISGGTDMRRMAYFKRIGGSGWSSNSASTVYDAVPHTSWRNGVDLVLEKARGILIQHINARLSADDAAITAARLKSDEAMIPEPIGEALDRAGLVSVMAAPGFYIIVMGLLAYFPLQALLALVPWLTARFDSRKGAAVAAIVLAMVYTFLLGAEPATLGFVLMFVVAVASILMLRRSDPIFFVMAAAALGLAVVPHAILDSSFQLPFAVVFCGVAASARLSSGLKEAATIERYQPYQRLFSFAKKIGRLALIAMAATMPFVLYHFQTINIYGFLANGIAIPVISFWVMPCLAIAFITAPFGLDGWFLSGANAGLSVLVKIAHIIASLPFSVIYGPAMPIGVLIIVILGGLWLCLMRQNWRYAGLIPVIMGLLYPLYTVQPDFIVAADGKEWAARLKDGRLSVSGVEDRFDVRQWQSRLGHPSLVDIHDLPDTEKQVRCDDVGCVYRQDKQIVALPILESAALEDCDRATIIVAPFIVKSCAASKIIDDPQLWSHGAHAVYFEGNAIKTVHTRPRRGVRPWSPGWKGNMDKDQNGAFP